MPRSKSSNRWLREHFNDVFVKKAQAAGYRSRAVYKLQEIDEKEHLLKPNMIVIELGAAPGGWTKYINEKVHPDVASKGKIIALDLLPMQALTGVDFICGDFQKDDILARLMTLIPEHGADVLLSDMAPNMSGNSAIDIPCAMYLTELVFDFGDNILKDGGALFTKIFHGEGFDELLKLARQKFKKVVIRKPTASRSRSRETYLLAKGYNL